MPVEMPNLPIIPCQCFPDADDESCVCGDSERVLRGWICKAIVAPMTPEQREWALNEIASVEGYDRKHYEGLPDAELARGVLSAWTDYCRDKGLL